MSSDLVGKIFNYKTVNSNPDPSFLRRKVLWADDKTVFFEFMNGTRRTIYDTSKSLRNHEEIIPKKKGWINIYPRRCYGDIFDTREAADNGSELTRIDCIEIEFNER